MAAAVAEDRATSFGPDSVLTGMLHIYVAFDWGDEVDLEHARRLLAAQPQALARRRRTPASFAYSPAPLLYPLEPVTLRLGGVETERAISAVERRAEEKALTPALSQRERENRLPDLSHREREKDLPAALVGSADATLFDFGGLSVAIHVPFSLTARALVRLAGQLADSDQLIDYARGAVNHLFATLRPAIQQAAVSPLTEEYVVFQFPPGPPLPSPRVLLEEHRQWLAGLVRLEAELLSDEQLAAALHSFISYHPNDLFVPEWSAALLVDQDCEETLQTIEFANLQLLEFRFIDKLLDDRLGEAYRLIHPHRRSALPFLRTHAHSLRALGELRMHANSLFERTGNALKLVGDQYLARVYRILSARFHLDDWEQSIQRSLEVVEGVYRVLADQAATYRTEILEVIVIVLIVFELLMAIIRH